MLHILRGLPKRLAWRSKLPALALFVLSAALIAFLPASAPASLAARLFESPVATPSPAAPTIAPPTPEPPTATPIPPTPKPTQTPTKQAPTPTLTPTPAPRGIDWGLFADTMALVFSYLWLVCGASVVVGLSVVLLVLYIRSRRRPGS